MAIPSRQDSRSPLVASAAFAALIFGLVSMALSAASRPQTSGALRTDAPVLENRALALDLAGPGRFRLTNKLSGKSYDVSAAPFELLLETGGRTAPATGADFALKTVARPSAEAMKVLYEGTGAAAGLRAEIEYLLPADSWYVRKRLTLVNGGKDPVVVRDATVEAFRVETIPFPEKKRGTVTSVPPQKNRT